MANAGPIRPAVRFAQPLAALRRALGRLQGDSLRRRGRRVVLLLVMLWILNIFDLICTMTVHSLGTFEEANPIARGMLQHPILVILFKLSMVAFATVVLLIYRRRLFVELACWAVCAIYLMLGLFWLEHLDESYELSRWIFKKF